MRVGASVPGARTAIPSTAGREATNPEPPCPPAKASARTAPCSVCRRTGTNTCRSARGAGKCVSTSASTIVRSSMLQRVWSPALARSNGIAYSAHETNAATGFPGRQINAASDQRPTPCGLPGRWATWPNHISGEEAVTVRTTSYAPALTPPVVTTMSACCAACWSKTSVDCVSSSACIVNTLA